eukprot:scaffold20601_cov146-Isochrysis_galbana.AAC.4
MKLASMTLPCWVSRVRSRHAAMADGRVSTLADRQGWTLVHSPATRVDRPLKRSSGVAIAVRMDSIGVSNL